MILFYAFFSLAVIYYTIDHRSYTYLRLIKQNPVPYSHVLYQSRDHVTRKAHIEASKH